MTDPRTHGDARISRYLLGALLAFTAAHSLHFSFLEGGLLVGDQLDNLVAARGLLAALEAGTSEAWLGWLRLSTHRPFVPAVVYLPAVALLSDAALAIRLVDTLLFLVVLVQLYDLGRRLHGAAAGVLAAYLFAVFPVAVSWSRGSIADPILWAALLLFFRALVDIDRRSPLRFVALGLAVGLCAGTRLLALVFMVGPLIWLLAFKVRTARHVLGLLGAAALAVALSGWWFVLQAGHVLSNLESSRYREAFPPDLPPLASDGLASYLALAVPFAACACYALARRTLGRDVVWLVLIWVLVPLAQFATYWVVWSRYLVMLVPPGALLVAAVICHLTASMKATRRRAVLAAVVACGAAPLALTYAGFEHVAAGAIHPDRARGQAAARVMAAAPAGALVGVIHRNVDPELVWALLHEGNRLGRGPLLPWDPAHRQLVQQRGPLRHLLLITDEAHGSGTWPRGTLISQATSQRHLKYKLYRLTTGYRVDLHTWRQATRRHLDANSLIPGHPHWLFTTP